MYVVYIVAILREYTTGLAIQCVSKLKQRLSFVHAKRRCSLFCNDLLSNQDSIPVGCIPPVFVVGGGGEVFRRVRGQ